MLLSRTRIVTSLKNIIYGLLLLCVGGIGPLTYLDGLSPHNGVQAYHIAILESTRVRRPLTSPPEFLTQLLRQRLLSQASGQTDFVSARPQAGSGLAHFFASGLSQGYLLNSASSINFNDTSPVSRVVPTTLIGRSVWLSPPEKPPSA
jgi:hypothetical protein